MRQSTTFNARCSAVGYRCRIHSEKRVLWCCGAVVLRCCGVGGHLVEDGDEVLGVAGLWEQVVDPELLVLLDRACAGERDDRGVPGDFLGFILMRIHAQHRIATASDYKHQSASNTHGHSVEHACMGGWVGTK